MVVKYERGLCDSCTINSLMHTTPTSALTRPVAPDACMNDTVFVHLGEVVIHVQIYTDTRRGIESNENHVM